MEDNGDDVCYSTVSFKNGKPLPKKREEEEDGTIYSEVKQKKTAPAEPSRAAEEAATLSYSRLLLVCLGILCVLLVVSVAIVIYLSMTMIKQQAEISDLSTKNQQLTAERKRMENQTEELSRERDELNRTFQVILTFDTFPVKDFCPDKKCQPCQKDWKVFQEKCYLFYDERSPWKGWKASRQYCQRKAADLVVIDDLQEQIFVSNHIKFYYDMYHGYWLGLRETGNNWMWVDGRNDTLGFWMKENLGSPGPFVLLIPGRNLTQNWDKAKEIFENKFICERQVLLKS